MNINFMVSYEQRVSSVGQRQFVKDEIRFNVPPAKGVENCGGQFFTNIEDATNYFRCILQALSEAATKEGGR